MTLALTQTATALGPRNTASFLGVGGSEPYVYSVDIGGAGGSIDSDTGVYTAPTVIGNSPVTGFDTIRVADATPEEATATILVGNPLILFCDVIQRELGLANGRVYLWDQKIMQPSDSGLYVAVSVPMCKPFANVNRYSAGMYDSDSEQYVSMLARVDIDIISRGPAARDRKEEVILALNSNYAQQQQEANGFYIGKLPPHGGFLNLSEVDGAAIPYRYKISVNLQYAFQKTSAVDYFDDFASPEVDLDPEAINP